MSDSNPVDIAGRAACAYKLRPCPGQLCPECKAVGHAVIAALEREGFPLIRREPTAGMVLAAYQTIHLALANAPMTPMDEYAAVFRIMVNAAPSYATPVEPAESGR